MRFAVSFIQHALDILTVSKDCAQEQEVCRQQDREDCHGPVTSTLVGGGDLCRTAHKCVFFTCVLSHYREILDWPKSSFRFIHTIVQRNPNELFGQSNIGTLSFCNVFINRTSNMTHFLFYGILFKFWQHVRKQSHLRIPDCYFTKKINTANLFLRTNFSFLKDAPPAPTEIILTKQVLLLTPVPRPLCLLVVGGALFPQLCLPKWRSLPCPPPGGLPNPGIEPRSPTLQADSLPAEPPGKPKNTGVGSLSLLQRIFPTQGSNRVSCITGGFLTNWAMREARWDVSKHDKKSL